MPKTSKKKSSPIPVAYQFGEPGKVTRAQLIEAAPNLYQNAWLTGQLQALSNLISVTLTTASLHRDDADPQLATKLVKELNEANFAINRASRAIRGE